MHHVFHHFRGVAVAVHNDFFRLREGIRRVFHDCGQGLQIHFDYGGFAHALLRFRFLFYREGFCEAFRFNAFRFLFHGEAYGFRLRFFRFGFLHRLVFLRVRFALTAGEFRFRFFRDAIIFRVRLFSDFRVELLFLYGDFRLRDFRFLFSARDVRVRFRDFDRLALVFLLNGISGVRFRFFGIGADLHFRLLNDEFGVLFGDLFIRFHFHGVCLFLRLRGSDRYVALGVCFGDLGVFADLFHVIDTHVFDRSRSVLEVLNVEIHHFDAQFFHIGHDVFRNFFRYALAILHHFFQSHRAYDFAHIAFQHLRNEGDEFLLIHVQQRFRRFSQQFGIGRNLDVRHAVYGDVDKFVRGNGFARFYVHLHHAQRKFVEPFDKGDTDTRFTDENTAFPEPRDDIRRIGRGFDIA